MSRTNLYQVLGVPTNATLRQIKKAKRKLLMEHHPDLHPDDAEAAKSKTREILDAARILEDPELRRRYDIAFLGYARKTTHEPQSPQGRPWQPGAAQPAMECPKCGYKYARIALEGRCIMCGAGFGAGTPPEAAWVGSRFNAEFSGRKKPVFRRMIFLALAVLLYFTGVFHGLRYGSTFLAAWETYAESDLGKRHPPVRFPEFLGTYKDDIDWRTTVHSRSMTYVFYLGAGAIAAGGFLALMVFRKICFSE